MIFEELFYNERASIFYIRRLGCLQDGSERGYLEFSEPSLDRNLLPSMNLSHLIS